MTNARTFLRTNLLAPALIAAPAADGPIKDREAIDGHFERDRETILAMAGDFKVRFDGIDSVDGGLRTARPQDIRRVQIGSRDRGYGHQIVSSTCWSSARKARNSS